MLVIRAAAIAALSTATSVEAQAVKSVVAASNGTEVTVYSDEFANRYEYTSPYVKSGDGSLAVATIKRNGSVQPVELSGFFVYSGEWRKYSSVIFRGGDAASFTLGSRDVGRCYSSRYSRPSCTLSESFSIKISEDQIRKHAQGGIIAIQLRADDTSTVIFEVPASYIRAVEEVAKR